MLATGRLLLKYSFPVVLLAAFLPVAAVLAQHGGEVTAEIVSKRYSSGYFPVAGSYVEYEVRLANVGDSAVENQSLWVSLVSDGNRTHSSASYSIALLEPGGSKTLHVGPFKMEEEGGHRLLAGMSGAAFNYQPDAFTVYRQNAIWVTLVAIPLMAAGAGVAGFSLYRKRRAAV